VGGIGQHDVALDGRQPLLQPLHQRHEGEVEEEQPVLGVVDDVDDLLVEEPRVDRVIDRADAGDAVPGLEMPPGVPGERRDAVAEPEAVPGQALRHLQGARADLAIAGAMDRALDRARHDWPRRMLRRGVVDDAVDEQGPVLHEALHGLYSRPGQLWRAP
jgi:hypothetical protein